MNLIGFSGIQCTSFRVNDLQRFFFACASVCACVCVNSRRASSAHSLCALFLRDRVLISCLFTFIGVGMRFISFSLKLRRVLTRFL